MLIRQQDKAIAAAHPLVIIMHRVRRTNPTHPAMKDAALRSEYWYRQQDHLVHLRGT